MVDLLRQRRLTNRASAAGARFAGAQRARSFYATRQAHKRNSSLLGRARQLQALVRRPWRKVKGVSYDHLLPRYGVAPSRAGRFRRL